MCGAAGGPRPQHLRPDAQELLDLGAPADDLADLRVAVTSNLCGDTDAVRRWGSRSPAAIDLARKRVRQRGLVDTSLWVVIVHETGDWRGPVRGLPELLGSAWIGYGLVALERRGPDDPSAAVARPAARARPGRRRGPIVGGRESGGPESNEIDATVTSQNNFQARFIIRHPWTGPIKCRHPQRGIWGGPPGGGEPPAIAARDLAFAARDQPLRSFLKKGLADNTALPGDPIKVDPYPRALGSEPQPQPDPGTGPLDPGPPMFAVPPPPASSGCASCDTTERGGRWAGGGRAPAHHNDPSRTRHMVSRPCTRRDRRGAIAGAVRVRGHIFSDLTLRQKFGLLNVLGAPSWAFIRA